MLGQRRTCGEEEEAEDGHDAHLPVGRGERQVQDDEGDPAVLERGLQGNRNDLKRIWYYKTIVER